MSEINFIHDLSHKQLKECPRNILHMSCLKMLYLEGNDLTVLPTELFVNLSQLHWLDVRNNRLKTLPPTIKNHPSLETVLLQNNDVEVLPLELGFVPNLKILQVSGNPITYPKKSVIDQGLNAIVDFLRNEYNQQQEVIIDVKDSEDSFEEFSKLILEMPISRKSFRKIGDYPRRGKKMHNSRSREVRAKEKERYLNSDKYLEKLPTRTNELRVEEQYLKDLWMTKLRNVMIKQEELLQRERDLETLDEWRHNIKYKNRKSNLTYRPDVPFDSDPAFDRLPSRFELEFQSNTSLDKQTRTIRPPKTKSKLNVEKLISDIIESLKVMEKGENANVTPRTQMHEAGSEIKRILDLQKRLTSLKLTNSGFI